MRQSGSVPLVREVRGGPSLVLLGICLSLAVLGGATASTPKTILLGSSVDGRRIVVIERGDPTARVKLLVVGCIHGNECSGIAVADRLLTLRVPRGVDLWVLPDLNPDGNAADTRGNARGVDLNRNFPWRWRRSTGLFYSGPRPLSEPESRLAYRLILRLRPTITIWFHQHLHVVDISGGNSAIERSFARLSGLPLRRLTRFSGSVTSWENEVLPGGTAFVVELPAGELTDHAAARFARAVLRVGPRRN